MKSTFRGMQNSPAMHSKPYRRTATSNARSVPIYIHSISNPAAQPAVVSTYDVIALILSLVNFSEIRNSSCATSGSFSWSLFQFSLSRSQTMQ